MHINNCRITNALPNIFTVYMHKPQGVSKWFSQLPICGASQEILISPFHSHRRIRRALRYDFSTKKTLTDFIDLAFLDLLKIFFIK